MRVFFTILLFFIYGCAKPQQNYLITKYGQAKMGTEAPYVPPPDPDPGDVDSVVINYNTITWTYLGGMYAGMNMISYTTAFPDSLYGGMIAVTGLAWDHANRRIIAVGTSSISSAIRERYFTTGTTQTLVDSTGADIGTQGLAYNSLINRYYRLLTTTINIRTNANGAAGSFTFPYTQPNAGMIDYDIHTGKFITSYDNYDSVIIWQSSGSTLTRVNGIRVAPAQQTIGQEGAARDRDGTIWVNAVYKKTHWDSTGNYLGQFAYRGTLGTMADYMGTVNEGYVIDPGDGTHYNGHDLFYHGSYEDGNGIAHFDPMQVYNKWLRIPALISWAEGTFTGTAAPVGNYDRARLTGTGTWISPVFDFNSYTLPHDESNWNKYGAGGLIEYRGSDDPPSTTATTTKTPFSYWTSGQSNEGWGSTSPSTWSLTAPANRYIQIRIKVIAND